MAEFSPSARCHWKQKDAFFAGDTCRHAFAMHHDAGNHVDNLGVGTACKGGNDDDEDTWCMCPGFEPSADSRRFPDFEEQQAYEKAMHDCPV